MISLPEDRIAHQKRLRSGDVAAVLGAGPASRPRLRRLLAWVVAAALVAAFALGAVWLSSPGAVDVRYVTEPVSRGDLTVLVTATGSAQPITQVNISSELSGTIRQVHVDYNSSVKAGQILAELDVEKLKATVESVRARRDSATARVAEAAATLDERRGQFERKKTLAGRDFGSVQELEQAKAAFDRAAAMHTSARSEAKVAEADLKLAEINLRKACICSPIDGVVLKRSVDPGQIVASSLQAPVLFVIAQDLRKMELHVDVDEADVGNVKPTQKATFSVDAYPGQKFPADIRDVRYGSEVVQGVVTYKAILSIDNSDLLIRPGMTATADIVVDEVRDALLIPNGALRYAPAATRKPGQSRSFLQMLLPRPPSATMRPPSAPAQIGPQRTIWTLRDGEAQQTAVVLGASDGRKTVVAKGGLAEGEPVIVGAVSSAR